jgi:hypothetical protein
VIEEAQLLGKDRDLVGVVTNPAAAEVHSKLPAFLLLNAGSVHHVGPNRLYVKIARRLASLGFVIARGAETGCRSARVRYARHRKPCTT